jgi:hypothetical protein
LVTQEPATISPDLVFCGSLSWLQGLYCFKGSYDIYNFSIAEKNKELFVLFLFKEINEDKRLSRLYVSLPSRELETYSFSKALYFSVTFQKLDNCEEENFTLNVIWRS